MVREKELWLVSMASGRIDLLRRVGDSRKREQCRELTRTGYNACQYPRRAP